MLRRQDVRYLLVNIPLTDPTAPYHSIPYLVGSAHRAGFTRSTCLDANVDALNYLASADQLTDLLRASEDALRSLERKRRLSRADQLLYRHAIKGLGLHPEVVGQAIEIFRSPNAFYDYGLYRQAVLVIKRWMSLLTILGLPGQFSAFEVTQASWRNLDNVSDLIDSRFLDRLVAPLHSYLEGPFRTAVATSRYDLIGLSVNYSSQLPFAVWITRYLRRVSPGTFLCLGGTEVTDVVKCLRDRRLLWRLFPDADAVVVGEGESALVELLGAIAQGTPPAPRTSGVLLARQPASMELPRLCYEDLAKAAEPSYSVWEWDNYWSPEPVMLHSPTRGCYWNKCTFCDYGLNTDTPTSPSRERPVEAVTSELRSMARIGRTVYFAVDAMSPVYLKKLCHAIGDLGVGIRWSAELRIERSFQKHQLADQLKRAGCVAVSFGYESGNQRVLDLIDKGIDIEQVPAVLKELARVGIAAQMMGFVGFPTETEGEAADTYNFLRRHRDAWALASIGEFVMTPGAIVARRPEHYGIDGLVACAGDDIVRTLLWRSGSELHSPGRIRDGRLEWLARSIASTRDDRPFVGGIDSAHSLLYFAKFGPRLIPSWAEPSKPLLQTVRYGTRHAHAESFVDSGALKDFHLAARAQGRARGAAEMITWLEEELDEHPVGTEVELEVFPGGQYLRAADPEVDAEPTDGFRHLREILLRAHRAL